jgi:hypothetical protein
MNANETAVLPEELKAIYEKFSWLERIYPQAEAVRVCIGNINDVGTVSNASAYLVQANGDFTEIEQKVVEKPLWPGTVFIDKYKEVDIAYAIQQANSAVYTVLIQNRCLTIFEKA